MLATYPEIAAILREEQPYRADAVDGSWLSELTGKQNYSSEIGKVVPPAFRHLSLFTLAASDASPLAFDVQESMIRFLRERDHLRGLVLNGAPGTGKTALASAWVKDNITTRVVVDLHEGRTVQPNCWRILARRWYSEHVAYATRKFDDNSIHAPVVSSQSIFEATQASGWPPLLWIDEIDNLAMTDAQHDAIDDLVNAVYEHSGTLILTTNYTVDALQENLSAKSHRRFLGTAETDKSLFVNFDLYAAPRR